MRRIGYKTQRNMVYLATQAGAGKSCIYYTKSRAVIDEAIKDFTATLEQTAFDFSYDKAERYFKIKPGGGQILIKKAEIKDGLHARPAIVDELSA